MTDPSVCFMKSVAELVEEISTLELEVIHLEQYLLSLYRTAFDRYRASSATAAGHASRPPVECHAKHIRQDSTIWISHQATHSINPYPAVNKSSHPQLLQRVDKNASNCRRTEHSPAHDLAFSSDLKDVSPFLSIIIYIYSLWKNHPAFSLLFNKAWVLLCQMLISMFSFS